jgi:hypothetical protein
VRTHQHLDLPFDLDRLPVNPRAQVVTDRQSIEFEVFRLQPPLDHVI